MRMVMVEVRRIGRAGLRVAAVVMMVAALLGTDGMAGAAPPQAPAPAPLQVQPMAPAGGNSATVATGTAGADTPPPWSALLPGSAGRGDPDAGAGAGAGGHDNPHAYGAYWAARHLVAGTTRQASPLAIVNAYHARARLPVLAAPGARAGIRSAAVGTTGAATPAVGTTGAAAPAASGWTTIGPAPTHYDPACDTCANSGDTSGRVTSMVRAADGTLYMGSAEGGVWKSTGAYTTWTPLTDDQPVLSIGALALDPRDNQTIYAGTGEANWSDSLYSAGVLKSTDGGSTWTLLGQSAFGAAYKTTCFFRDHGCGTHISGVAVDPLDSTVVLVATDFGLYRSTDGGANTADGNSSFSPVGANSIGTAVVSDMFFVPYSTTVYAAVGDPFGAAANGLYRSLDAGATWARYGTDYPMGTGAGRASIAEAPSDPGALYLAIARPDSDRSAPAASLGVWRSADYGRTWTLRQHAYDPSSATSGANADLFGYGDGSMWQGDYDTYIAVDPRDSSRVYVGGIDVWMSADGGATFANLTNSYPYQGEPAPNTPLNIHSDQHAIAFVDQGAGQPASLVLGNDGGVYGVTAPGSSAPRGVDDNTNLSLTQFYSVGAGTDAGGSTAVYGGAQDNGTQKGAGGAFREVYGGDGGFVSVDPANANDVWVEYVYGEMYHSLDGGATYQQTTTIGGQFITPFVRDPHNKDHVIAGAQVISETLDGGASWHMVNTRQVTGGETSALAFAPGDVAGRTWYAGGSDGALTVTADDGATYRDIAGGTVMAGDGTNLGTGLPHGYIASIGVAADNARDVVVTFDGFTSANGAGNGGHVFRSTDGGVSWTDLSYRTAAGSTTGLPDAPVNAVLRNPRDDNTFYIGTDTGFYVTTDGGMHWYQYNNVLSADGGRSFTAYKGMPDVAIYALAADKDFTTLYAGTHGRGMYSIPVSSLLSAPGVPRAVYAPSLLDFGRRMVHAGGPAQTVTITNTNSGAATLHITSTTADNSADYTVATGCQGRELGSGQSCTLTVAFTPTITGARPAMLRIVDNSGATPSEQDVTLSGTGIAPQAGVSPTGVDFGAVPAGTSVTRTVTVSNTGDDGTTLSIGSALLDDGQGGTASAGFSLGADSCSGRSLARDGGVSAICTVAVRFAPTTAGSAMARLVIPDNAGGQPITQAVPLSGTGQSPATSTATSIPTTAVPTTAVPTTAVPTTAVPTTAIPTTAVPTTATPTQTATAASTSTPTATAMSTPAQTATATGIATAAPSPTNTITASPTRIPTTVPSETATQAASATSTSTVTPAASATSTDTTTSTPTTTPTVVIIPVPVATGTTTAPPTLSTATVPPAATATPVLTAQPASTTAPEPAPASTSTPSPTNTPSPTSTGVPASTRPVPGAATSTPLSRLATATATPGAGSRGNRHPGRGATGGHATGPGPAARLGLPSAIQNGDAVTVQTDHAGANASVMITAELSLITVTSRTVTIYVPASRKGAGPRVATAKGWKAASGALCRKGVRGCVARRVARGVTMTTILYRAHARARADRHGSARARLALRYGAPRLQRLTLVVTAWTPRGTIVIRRAVTVKPGRARGR